MALKRDLSIIFKNCMTGEYSGPYPPNYPTSYDSSSNSITICYNALQELNDFASSMGIEGGQQDQKSTNEIIEKMALFFLTHEMGHALLNELNLTQNEADSHQITLTLAPKLNIVGEEIILMPPMASIGLFYLKGLDYSETHLIGLEDYACWVYGQDPQKYAILQSNWITSEREKTCVQEYTEIINKWNPILTPVLKN